MSASPPAKASTAKPKQPSRLNNLFFMKRRPRLRGIPLEWQPPADEAAYQKLLDDDGFISSALWKKYDMTKYPVIAQDLRDLEQHLMPTFWKFSQGSKYYQNQYILFQWVFILGAFLTTLFGTLTTYVYTPVGFGLTNAPTVEVTAEPQAVEPAAAAAPSAVGQPNAAAAPLMQTGGNEDLARVFGYMTAIIGAITGFFTALSNRGEPQKRWAKNRRLAEELRMHYYKYLSHLPPYDTPNRLQILRQTVVDSRIKEQANVG